MTAALITIAVFQLCQLAMMLAIHSDLITVRKRANEIAESLRRQTTERNPSS